MKRKRDGLSKLHRRAIMRKYEFTAEEKRRNIERLITNSIATLSALECHQAILDDLHLDALRAPADQWYHKAERTYQTSWSTNAIVKLTLGKLRE